MIGVITALPVEAAALQHALGPVEPVRADGDGNHYLMARLACGDVVITSLAATSNVVAADACAHLVRSFPRIRAVIMCGIALGVPQHGVRLGDVVVGTGGVVHYSHRRVTDDGGTLRGHTLVPSPLLLRAVNDLRVAELKGERPWERWLTPLPGFESPGGEVRVFHGAIGSGDELLRSAARRDELAREHGVLAMEMEGAGTASSAWLGGRECLVVRGVSDHGDAAKNDDWHRPAATAAAAYTRALLEALPPAARERRPLSLLDLVEVMERVGALRTPAGRDDVLLLLGPDISGRVRQSDSARSALLSLARVCAEYDDGLGRLQEVVERLDGRDSAPVRELAAAIAGYRAQS
ncbi:hypothetical protein OUY22_22070 [Nonomuraea sp. MCN248]|uniref:Nucleoside phosphorylase domain-containing protein n=1 Tax=Nonomuraea corallina TaxID=2989783 RepID=A0ABT4SG03_9ACTN|nr:hypothetical protein [Nonomuraea corallina]MDA0636117.1 hypothetical protein [Nonomuraea corallina]